MMKRILCLFVLLAVCSRAVAADTVPSPVLDFTKGDKPDAKARTFFMHLAGVVNGIPNATGDRLKEATQIYLRDVKDCAYIESILQPGDVLLGVNGEMFKGDAVKTFRAALAAAKEPGSKGSISVIFWHAGERKTVEILALPPPPDLTKDGRKDSGQSWNLGPTGAKGWVFSRGLSTAEARQILVTEVTQGSPAAGLLATNDVIVGLSGTLFDSDALQAFGCAVTDAEKLENKGLLKLVCWQAGKQRDVTIPLKVMGSYSETSPSNCPKASLIVEQGCRGIVTRGIGDGIVGDLNALALLASGNPEYLDTVKAYAHAVAKKNMKLELKEGMFAWPWGYDNLFLAEYYLATRDESVLPAIRELSTKIAEGQGATGLWGHGMRIPESNGTLGGYGAVNQSGIICWMSMGLAQKCGIDDPVVKQAVVKARKFFTFHVGKGCIPYGDHPVGAGCHDNNGTSGSAALAFDFIGDEVGAQFFSRMATAAYAEKEAGHTGNFFGYLWGALGANRSGPEALAAYMKELRWYYDLARRWDGSFGTNKGNNYGWDMTALFVLHYTAPRQRLYITGKGASPSNQLTGEELKTVIDSGRDVCMTWEHSYLGHGNEQLLKELGSWSPVVRFRAAAALGRRGDDVVPQVIGLLNSTDLKSRYGACQALQSMGTRAAPATDKLIELLSHDDLWLQIQAAFALKAIGPPARQAVPQMLKMALAVDTTRDPDATLCRYLNYALFKNGEAVGLLSDSLEGVDRALLYPAIRRMLTLDDGMCRSCMTSIFKNLSLQELQPLIPDIVKVASDTAPSGEMFAQEIRVKALAFLASNKIPEGLPAFIAYARTQNGWGSQTIQILPLLKEYGPAAGKVLPELKELQSAWQAKESNRKPDEPTRARVAEDVIKTIEANR